MDIELEAMDVIQARLDLTNPMTDVTILFVYGADKCDSKIYIKSRRNCGGYFSTQVPGCSWRINGDPGFSMPELDTANKTLYIPTDVMCDTKIPCERSAFKYFINSINKHIEEIAADWEGEINWKKNF